MVVWCKWMDTLVRWAFGGRRMLRNLKTSLHGRTGLVVACIASDAGLFINIAKVVVHDGSSSLACASDESVVDT